MKISEIIFATTAQNQLVCFTTEDNEPVVQANDEADFIKALVSALYKAWVKEVGADSSVYVPSEADLDLLASLKSVAVNNSQKQNEYAPLDPKEYTLLADLLKKSLQAEINAKTACFREKIADLKQHDFKWHDRVSFGVAFCLPYDLVRKTLINTVAESQIFTHELIICLGGARKGYKGLYVEKNEATSLKLLDIKKNASEEISIDFSGLVKMCIDNGFEITFALNHAIANPKFKSKQALKEAIEAYTMALPG